MQEHLKNSRQFVKIKKILHRQPMMVLIHITDTYFIEETTVNDNVDLPGFARFYSLIDFIKSNPVIKNNNIPVFVLHGGDFLFPSLMSTHFHGEQMVEVLNECGINYCTIGNHDFDGGIKYFQARLSEFRFDIVCANIELKKNVKNSVKFFNHIICQNKDSQLSAALVGIAGEATTRKARQNEFNTYPAELSLKNTIDKIRKTHPEINHLIVLSHMSNQEDMHLEKWLDRNWHGYSYLLGGHDHNKILHYNNKNPNSKSILMKGQSNCRTVQILGLHENTNPKDSRYFTKNVLALDSDTFSQIQPSPRIQKIIKKWKNLLEANLKEKKSDKIIKRFKANTVLDATELQLRKGSTNFGNFIADCMLEFVESDMAFINSGHFRGDRKIGDALKLSDLRRIFVLDDKNSLVKIPMTASECIKLLRHAYSEEGRGKILQVSKNTIKLLQNSSPNDKLQVVMLWDMLKTDDDGFATILAKTRKTTVSKLQSKLKKSIIPNSSLFDVVEKTSKDVKYDPKIRINVNTFEDKF